MLCFLNPASLFYSQALARLPFENAHISIVNSFMYISLQKKKHENFYFSMQLQDACFNCTSRSRPGPGFICFPGKHWGESAVHRPCPLRQEVLLVLGFVSQDSCVVTALEGPECSMQPQAEVCLLPTISETETVRRQALVLGRRL